MTPITRAKLELATEREVRNIIAKDAPKLSTKVDEFINANLLAFYIVINTWLLMIKQYSGLGWARVLDAMTRDGLIPTIRRFTESADSLARGLDLTDSLTISIRRDVATVLAQTIATPEDQEKEIGKDLNATLLCLFRYPKRFSPVGNDRIQAASIQKFLDVENRSKLLQRRGYSAYLIDYVRAEMEHIIDWDNFINEATQSLQSGGCELTSGANFDARASLGSKLVALSRTEPSFFPDPFGFKWSGAYERGVVELWGTHQDSVRPVDVRAVPKSYKASRIIAMETVRNQGFAKAVSIVLDRYMPGATPIHDQSVNQYLALFGSETGALATEDLSNASDTITKLFAMEIMPKRASDFLLQFLGTHTVIDGKRRVMQQLSTAGNSLTFQLESLVFLAICRACTKLYEFWSGDTTLHYAHTAGGVFPVPSVYGDDQIIDARVHDTYLDVMKALGFIVNETKSFASGSYRESCGAEFLDGVDVSGYYFPRFPIEGTLAKHVSVKSSYRRDSYTGDLADSMTSLVSLQHRLSNVCYEASYFVTMLVREAYPKMTTSIFGSPVGDCWDYEDVWVTRYGPAGEILHTREKWRDVRTLRKVKDERLVRTAKFLPAVKWTLSRQVTDAERRLFELYKYRQFLQHGPRYDDPLLRLLGVSSPPMKLEEAFGSPEVFWALREVDYQ